METPDKTASLPRNISYVNSRHLENPCYIDVRSPEEYAGDHIAGALNLPLFDNEERALLGEVYRRSQQQARFAGLDMAAAKLPRLLRELNHLHQQYPYLVLYCWRGGLRSQAVQDTAHLLRIPCLRIEGGYREYRRWLTSYLAAPPPFRMVVLHGLTGCGKTAVLNLLRRHHGLQALDLEGLACHRGSVFGHIGLSQQPSQKYFQSLLVQELVNFDSQQPLLLECESRRIGRLLLDETFFTAMKQATPILLYDTPSGRAQRLLKDYQPATHPQLIQEALCSPPLRKKFSPQRLEQLTHQLEQGEYAKVITFLLLNYYDPLYHYPDGPSPDYDLCVNASDEEAAARQIAEYIRRSYGQN